ncbi:MAG: dihydroorotase [Gammaproteobacteria bacterium]|nr:dihydroorotase [Gammaproteobacteria bacterium]
MNIYIKGGRVIDPANNVDKVTDLFIREDKIISLDKAPNGFQAELTIDANNCVVCPGLVDMRARLREPGLENKGTIESETLAAAHGGVTTLCTPPDTDPIIDTPAVVDLIRHRVAEVGKCKVITLGALTVGLQGSQLSEIDHLKKAGCVGVTNAYCYISSAGVMRRAMEYVASLDMTLYIHAEDKELSENGCVHEGEISTRLGLAGIPECAETIAVSRDLMLIEKTGVRAHFCQLSTEQAVKMVARAQHDGLPVTADVTAHQLHLTEMDIGYFNSLCHVSPPLRNHRDLDGLRDAVGRGVVSAICSDHQPHDVDAKLAPFAQTESGISSIETLLPLALRLVDEKGLSLSDIIAKLTCGPANILGINAGTLGVSSPADVCVFDPESYWNVTEETFYSHGKNSPFIGWELKGQVTHTILDGEVVFQLKN